MKNCKFSSFITVHTADIHFAPKYLESSTCRTPPIEVLQALPFIYIFVRYYVTSLLCVGHSVCLHLQQDFELTFLSFSL